MSRTLLIIRPTIRLLLILCAGLLAGCARSAAGPGDVTDGEDHETLPAADYFSSQLERDLDPDTTPGEFETLIRGNHQFTLAMFDAISGDDTNCIFSPVSIRIAFAMTSGGARGETLNQIAEFLSFGLDQSRLHPAFNAFDLELSLRNKEADNTHAAQHLQLVNAMWGRQGLSFQEEYLDLLAVHYGAGLRTLDFAIDPEGSRQVINRWIEENTRDLIRDLLPPGAVTELTVSVLTNAIYLEAPWEHRFNENKTADSTFTTLGGVERTIPFMQRKDGYRFMQGEGFKALEMSFREDELSMVFLLPDAGRFPEFRGELEDDLLAEIIDQLDYVEVEIAIPRFEFGSRIDLRETLGSLGMSVPFDPLEADFTGITEVDSLFISGAFHQAFIKVDEKGTVAAAASAVVHTVVGMPPPPEYRFIADRPFIFLIRDRITGAILFFGQLTDPS